MFPTRLSVHFKERIGSKQRTYLNLDSLLVFTCGAQRRPDKSSARSQVMEYVERHVDGFRFFEAEDFFDTFTGLSNTDLLSVEEKLADFSD